MKRTNPFVAPFRRIPPEEIAADEERRARLKARLSSYDRSRPSLEAERSLLFDLLEIAGLPGYERFAKVGARMVPTDLSPTLGQSRLGGSPDLPRGASWPEGPDGASLPFLAQVRVRELPAEVVSMGRDALISLFYDRKEQPWGVAPEDRHRFRVRIDEVDDLVGVPSPIASQPGTAVEFVPVLTLPAVSSPTMVDLDQDVRMRWAGVVDTFERVRLGVRHQFGGHPQLIQGPIEETSAFTEAGIVFNFANREHPRAAELEAEAHQWRLLFQIDSEPARNWYWEDAGRLYASIREDHLLAGRGEHAWVQLQCG